MTPQDLEEAAKILFWAKAFLYVLTCAALTKYLFA